MSEHNPEIKLYVFVSIYQSDPPELVYAENVEQARALLNEKYNPFAEYREPKVFDIPVSPTLIDYHQGE